MGETQDFCLCGFYKSLLTLCFIIIIIILF